MSLVGFAERVRDTVRANMAASEGDKLPEEELIGQMSYAQVTRPLFVVN